MNPRRLTDPRFCWASNPSERLPQIILRQVGSQHGDGVRLAHRMLEAGEDDALSDCLQDCEIVSQLVFRLPIILPPASPERARRSNNARALGWSPRVGVTLGLLLLVEAALPSVGEGVVALGTAVVIANILVGPVILKRALSGEVSR